MAGDVVTDVLSTGLSAIHFDADATLQRLHFMIKSWDGTLLMMSNHEISFEIIIQRP